MINCPNNILSYFIKDIKDATEVSFYKQINLNNGYIQILYKDELIYNRSDYLYNYINNIIKQKSNKYIRKPNITYNYINKYKILFYNQDRTMKFINPNHIRFYFTYNKYLQKLNFQYCMKDKYLLFVSIIYLKKYKYIIRNYNIYYIERSIKFTSSRILIPNKYELDYYCKFCNLYI